MPDPRKESAHRVRLCALPERLPPLVPAPLFNVLALLAGVHALLPFDGAPRAVPPSGARRMTATSPGAGTGAGRRGTVSAVRGCCR